MTDLLRRRILVVDDETDNVELLKFILAKKNYEVVSALSGKEAFDKIKETFFTVVLLDIKMPKMNGLEVLERLKKESPHTLVILLTAYSTPENIKQACKADVYDFLEKPIDNDLLLLKIQNAFKHFLALLKNTKIKKEILFRYPCNEIIYSTQEMKKVMTMVDKVAPSDACVLITGESGTGKEIIARAIHYKSGRNPLKFQAVNAGALSETLLGSELFGHVKGAFTDAKTDKVGYFESCSDGTIFLDEIGDISPQMQKSLLRVIEEQKIIKLGSTTPIEINTRVITATNQNLEQLVKEGAFRQDLYYRINPININLPPLRDRKKDIPLLIEYFLLGYDVKISNNALRLLMDYHYPGNIRELDNILTHALLVQEDGVIEPDHLPPVILGRESTTELHELFNLPWKKAKNRFEKKYLESILNRTNGNISLAAKESGIDRSYIHKQIRKYNIIN